MARPRTINLGVFAAGELPYPVVHRFTVDGGPIVLTDWECWTAIEGPDGLELGTGATMIVDASDGAVQYTWAQDDFQGIGKYRMLIWVDNSINRFASDLIIYETYDGPGPIPLSE